MGLTHFSSYSIEFHSNNNSDYLLFQGENTTIYLCEEGVHYLLFLADQNGHEIYMSKAIQLVQFSFDSVFKINGLPMELVSKQGYVNLSDSFEEIFYAPVKQIIGTNQVVDQLQLCLDFSIERMCLKFGIGIASFLILLSNFSKIQLAGNILYELVKHSSWKPVLENSEEDVINVQTVV